ncbi:alpha/beta fold hydrolase [Phaeocystidibacter luteus]|uniref:Alpha/beta hydrolase n=1 Tax=Phaeocystidibacter luteus TaxID=911197 RepID=A0A6N6RIW2_9FLAO|nr:alpha/beta hydrolase [Phaeocystidibacter luteus]KAB2805389.1 alpha/beta hydrolase [Phaeocystidibacter luteus]
MSSKFISHRGTPIHYTDAGRGSAVILLHGFLENSTMWKDYAAELAKSYRVICIDLPGHGKSDCFGYVHSMDEMAAVVKAIADHHHLKRYHIVGHSMGGYVALAFGEKHPDVPKSITLFHSTALADSDEKKVDRSRAIKLVKEQPEAFVKHSLPMLFRSKSRKIYRTEIKGMIAEALKMPVQGIIAALEGMKERPDREVLLHLSPIPFLFITGKRDTVLPFEKIEPQLSAPMVVDRLITENGHMGFIEDRDLCLETLTYFINDIEKAHA